MKIVDVRELAVPLQGQIANAVVNFAEHDVSLLALVTDVVRHGKPVVVLDPHGPGAQAYRAAAQEVVNGGSQNR